jgi:DNA-binding NarL/FixJ family response regulator
MVTDTHRKRILVVDDQGLIQEGLARIISRQKDFELCGSVDNTDAAQKAVAHYKPDLVLIDLLLPDGCGLDLIKNLVSEHPSLSFLVVSQCDEALYAERALKAGARGYIMKNCPVAEIPKAMRTVLAGEFYVSPRVAALALHRMAGGGKSGEPNSVGNLTDRELQIFQLLGAGVDTKEIAEKLHLSIKTVETHRENIKHKLKLSNAAELVHYATNWVSSQSSAHRAFPGTLARNSKEDHSPE